MWRFLVVVLVVACHGDTSLPSSAVDSSVSIDLRAPPADLVTDSASGTFACGNALSCLAGKELCLDSLPRDGGGTLLCMPIPSDCAAAPVLCDCLKLRFQCPITCTQMGGSVFVSCG